jgi:Cu(I)/Ag(I) efflux system membrane fusion protein
MKRAKWIILPVLALTLATAVLSVAGCSKTEPAQSGGTQAKQYTCSMHPDLVKDAPGNCPKCGMKLVDKK